MGTQRPPVPATRGKLWTRSQRVLADADQISEVTASNGWLVSYQRTVTGPFEFRYHAANSGNITVSQRFFASGIHAVGSSPKDRVAVLPLVRSGGRARLQNHEFQRGAAAIFAPHAEVDLSLHGPTSTMTVLLPAGPFEGLLTGDGALSEVALAPMSRGSAAAHDGLSTLRAIATSILRGQDAAGDSSHDAHAAARAERELIELVWAMALGHREAEVVPAPYTRQLWAAYASRAHQMMVATCDQPLSMPELSAALGLTPRLVHYAFKAYYGTSPIAYHRLLRLQRARWSLTNASDPGVSITSVAMDRGFWHLGNFSRYYARAFGESPSDTLRRARASRPLLIAVR